MAKQETKKVYTVSIKPDTMKAIDALAAFAGRSRSDYVERLFAEQIDRTTPKSL